MTARKVREDLVVCSILRRKSVICTQIFETKLYTNCVPVLLEQRDVPTYPLNYSVHLGGVIFSQNQDFHLLKIVS